MSSIAGNAAAAAAIIEQERQRKMYALVVSGTSDIQEISTVLKTEYAKTVKTLENIIGLATPRNNWYAFAGAHIDREKNQIVLANPINKVVVCMEGTGLGAILFAKILMYILGIGLTILFFAMIPNIWIALIPSLGAAAFAAGMLLLLRMGTNRVKRIQRYPELIPSGSIKPLADIAKALKKPVDFVRKDLLRWVKLGWLSNLYIDLETDSAMLCNEKPKE